MPHAWRIWIFEPQRGRPPQQRAGPADGAPCQVVMRQVVCALTRASNEPCSTAPRRRHDLGRRNPRLDLAQRDRTGPRRPIPTYEQATAVNKYSKQR